MKNKTIVYLKKDISSAALKRAAIADYFGEAEIEKEPSGKPIIKNPEGYYISVSHSGGVVAIIISDKQVGIDIEEKREIDFEKIRKGFFSESEKNEPFFDVWVKREAEGKLSGEGVFALRKKELFCTFTFISKEVSQFAGRDFSGCIASKESLFYTIKEL
jgi:phosphopantetheinyl transferase